MEVVKSLPFDASVSSMEYIPDGEVLVITYGKTIAFYNALRYEKPLPHRTLRYKEPTSQLQIGNLCDFPRHFLVP